MNRLRWIFSMAWRDSRGSRRRLLLFVSSMVLGVAALVAINSFGDNLRQAIDEQAQTLLGADMSMENRKAFSDSLETLVAEIGGEQSRQISFPSMALFPESGGTRLSTIRAQDGLFPWYGEIETDPPDAADYYVSRGEALVDKTLMQQFTLVPGDSVRVGTRNYRIAGALLKTPRESSAVSLFSPRVYIPLATVDTSLFGFGSQARYEIYFRFRDGRDVEAMADTLREALRPARVGIDTVLEEKENWDEALGNLYRFLGLVGFVALLLGGLGVASAVHVYIRQRIDTVAVLRCYGASSWATIGVYTVQAIGMGLVGALAGATVGVGVQFAIPSLLADALPVDVSFSISWPAILLGSGIGVGVTVLFTLMPLLAIRTISPLRAIRSQIDSDEQPKAGLITWLVRLAVVIGVVGFSILQAPSPAFGLVYAGAIGVVFLALILVALGLSALVKRSRKTGLPYIARQGLANLYRPNNQTVLLSLALGLGTFLIATMLITQRTLLSQVQLTGGDERANLVFFDIQPDQAEGVQDILRDVGIRVIDEVPMVTMRVRSVKGKTVQNIRDDSTRTGPVWPYTREYRSTYRSKIIDSEKLIEGVLYPSASLNDAVIPISAEKDLAADMGLALGDTMVWDVQGLPVTTVIASIREVDWRRIQTNFFFVFPDGVLEAAPQFTVVLSRAEDDTSSANAQAAVVRSFPNVSAIDITLVLSVFDAIFSRIAFVIRFMALFSVLTGFIVLSGAVVMSRLQRISESVLLKTLGASQSQIQRIMFVEYLALGTLASLTGLALALASGWGLARFVFDTPFVAGGPTLLLIAVGVVAMVVAIGWYSGRGIYRRQALEVLRSET